MDDEFYVCDLRDEWKRQKYLSFWRPKNCGYAWALSWSGKYTKAEIDAQPRYYTHQEDRKITRFAVPCDIADALGVAPIPRTIDNDAGPVIMNTAKNRATLLAAMYLPSTSLPAA